MKKFVMISIVLIIYFILSACTINGEDVFVYAKTIENQELIKVKAITEYDQSNQNLHVKAIIDVFDKDKKYKKTVIYHIKGNIESSPSVSHVDGPLTILTHRNNVELSASEKRRVKTNVISHTNQID